MSQRSTRRLNFICIAATSVVVVGLLFDIVFLIKTELFTCAICRKHAIERSVKGHVVERVFEENACSIWLNTMSLKHQHLWVSAPFYSRRDILGLHNEGGIRTLGESLWALPPEKQLKYLQKYESCGELKKGVDIVSKFHTSFIDNNEEQARNLLRRIRLQLREEQGSG